MAKRYDIKPRFDHSKIREWFKEGKENKEIAKLSGYSPEYIGELRWKASKKWY